MEAYMESIHVPVKLELPDYQYANRLSNEKSTYVMYGFFLSAIIGNIMVNDISGIVYILVILAVWEIYKNISVRRQCKSNKRAHKETVYEFNSDGIAVTSVDGRSNSNIKWEELAGIKQNKHVIFLMTSGSSGYIIPKRTINEIEIATLEELFKQSLDPKRFIKTNIFKYVVIGILLNIITLFFAGTLKFGEQQINQGNSMRRSIVTLGQLILMILTFGSGIVFIVQFIRWVYGLFVTKHSMKFNKVFLAFLAFICMVIVIGFIDYYVYSVWKLHKS